MIGPASNADSMLLSTDRAFVSAGNTLESMKQLWHISDPDLKRFDEVFGVVA